MRDIFKLVLTDFFIIIFGVLLVTSVPEYIASFISGVEFTTYPAEYPFIVIITGVLGALPSFMFYFRNEPTKKQFNIRLILHYLVVEIIIMTEGFFLKWYENILEGIIIFVFVLIVYAIVLLCTMFISQDTANSINKALSVFNQNEEE